MGHSGQTGTAEVEEPGTLEYVARLAADWFQRKLRSKLSLRSTEDKNFV